jgi:TolB-like protein/tRNA A-37 threonylcarbamoyl transferase component Bud32
MSLKPDQKLGHYTILSSLGSGGMGEVYLAEDARLGRQVAVKVLPQELLKDEARRRRFVREARVAASVDHPHIVHIYEVAEESDGSIYLVMQHVEGKTIRQLLAEGHLERERALGLASEVAEALAAAHHKAIVHRDIKPDNIMVDGSGHARVLDFGLARLLDSDLAPADATHMETVTRKTTSAGAVMGTMAYMSPEQARGAEVDGRSDIFSLGITLYEMLARRHPFAGRTGVETVDSLLNRDPKPMGSVAGGLPPETEWILSKMMAKKAEDRYQSADDLLVDLRKLRQFTSISGGPIIPATKPRRRWLAPALVAGILLVAASGVAIVRALRSGEPAPAGGQAASGGIVPGTESGSPDSAAVAAAAGKLRLAVLPLQNVSGDSRVDFLGFALADATIAKLSYLEDVTVRPSSFIQRYRERAPEDPQEVGRALNVDHLLTGSLLTQGDALRVNVQFVDLAGGSVRWEETIDAKLDNLLSVQDEVVSRIVSRMRLKLTSAEREDLSRDRARNPEAFDLFLRAIAQPDNSEGITESIRLAEQSLALDDTFAPAWVELARRKYFRALFTEDTQPSDYDDALDAVLEAERLNPESPQMIHTLAVQLTERDRHEEAWRRLRGWVKRHPNDASGHFALSYLFRYTGLLEEAAREASTAITLDPGNPTFRSAAAIHSYMGDLLEADRYFNLDPDSRYTLFNKSGAYLVNGREDLFRRLVLDHMRTHPEDEWLPDGMRLIAEERIDEARQVYLEVMGRGEFPDPESRYHFAATAASLGFNDEALDLLRSTVDGGFYCYPLFERDSRLESLRSHPRFQPIVDRARERSDAFRRFITSSE